MEDSKPNALKQGGRWGLYGGLAAIVLYCILYALEKSLVVNFLAFNFMIIPVILGTQIVFGTKLYKENLKDLTFRQTIKPFFIIAILVLLLWFNFHVLMVNFINPDLQVLAKQEQIEMITNQMEYQGKTEYDIQIAIEDMGDLDYSYSLGRWFSEYTRMLIPGFFYSLIIASIVYFVSRPQKT